MSSDSGGSSRSGSTGPDTGEDLPSAPEGGGTLHPPAPPVDPDADPDVDSTLEGRQDGQGAQDGHADDGEMVEVDIELLLAERDQFKDIALRLQADFENYRRRVATQQGDEVDRATGKVVEAVLPVLDACEAAAVHGVAGVEPIWSALIGALQKQGLEALDLQGQVFDPAVAEAVVHEPGDGGEPVVSEVLRTGYLWKGKVLRAAMVKVRD